MKTIGKILCWVGIHKVKEEDWIDMWCSDDYSGKEFYGEKNLCTRCGKRILRNLK